MHGRCRRSSLAQLVEWVVPLGEHPPDECCHHDPDGDHAEDGEPPTATGEAKHGCHDEQRTDCTDSRVGMEPSGKLVADRSARHYVLVLVI